MPAQALSRGECLRHSPIPLNPESTDQVRDKGPLFSSNISGTEKNLITSLTSKQMKWPGAPGEVGRGRGGVGGVEAGWPMGKDTERSRPSSAFYSLWNFGQITQPSCFSVATSSIKRGYY